MAGKQAVAATQHTITLNSDAANVDSPGKESILVLISHSSKDVPLAEALINLLRSGLGLLASQIRCSSVDGYRLPAGVNTGDKLRKEIKSAKVLIGLLTPNSLSSTYVLFELGARWGAELFMIPLLAGIKPEEMHGPHSVLNALSCETEAQLIQLVENIGQELNVSPQSAASYMKEVRAVMELAEPIRSTKSTESSNQQGDGRSAAVVDRFGGKVRHCLRRDFIQTMAGALASAVTSRWLERLLQCLREERLHRLNYGRFQQRLRKVLEDGHDVHHCELLAPRGGFRFVRVHGIWG